MTEVDKRKLLEAMGELAKVEAENVVHIKRVFLPLPSHRLALRPEIVVVRGGRGAGKSALFRLTKDLKSADELRGLFAEPTLPDATWLDAFSQGPDHPHVEVLDRFAEGADTGALRAFWMGHLLHRLAVRPGFDVLVPEVVKSAWNEHGHIVDRWVPVVLSNLGAVAAALDRIEQTLTRDDGLIFASYDHLDRIGPFKPDTRRRYIGALLALWLSYSNRYNKLRAKIFLRDDLFDAGELGFPDASKLRARSVSIDWDTENLYRLVTRYMADSSEAARDWLARVKDLTFRERGEFGWMPGPMPETLQDRFASRLAGETMGSGSNKGYTYRWIPNHLQDSQRRIAPRSMLNLFGFAAQRAKPPARGARLLRTQDLVSALDETSKHRVSEIREEYELVERLENLRGMQVLLDRSVAIERLSRPTPSEEADGKTLAGEAILDELVRLGVLSIRTNGRIDVPDIYRSGFGILRKGGAARAR